MPRTALRARPGHPGPGDLDRRRFINEVFDGKPHERLPRAIFGGGLWAYAQAGFLPERIGREPGRCAEALSDLYAGLDTDILFLGSGLNTFPAEAIGGTLRFEGPCAPLLARPLIGSHADLRRLGRIDLSGSPHVAALARVVAAVRQALPDRFLCATSWGPFTWAMVLCEDALLREKLATDRPFVAAVAELGMRISLAFFELLIDRALIDGISVPDGAVTLIPDDDYRDLVLPRQRELFDRVRALGPRSVLHMCGRIGPQLPLYRLAGAECISVDCSVALGDAYRLFGDAIVTAGNVDAVGVLERGDEAAVRAAVASCVGQVTDRRRRFILMPSCDLPVSTPRRNVEAFLGCADETPQIRA